MGCTAAKMFMSFLESKNIKGKYVDDDERTIAMGWKLKNTTIDIYFIFDEDNHDVHIQGLNFMNISEENFGKALQIVNICNQNYRWVKFTLDMEHGQVIAEDDAVIQLDSCTDEVFELMLRMSQVVDDAYPKFMKALWG